VIAAIRSVGGCGAACALLAIGGPTAGGAADWKSALDKPVSPGALALLTPNGREVDARERLRQGLRDPRAEVRAAAARVITISGVSALADELMTVLQREEDAAAAEEEVLALVTVGGPAPDQAIVDLARQRPERAPAVLIALARRRGPSAWPHVWALRSALKARQLNAVFLQASRGQAEGLTPAAIVATRDQDADAWDAVLAVAREQDVDLSASVASALGSPSDTIRASTRWHVLLTVPDDGTLHPLIRDVLSEVTEPVPQNLDEPARVAFELVRRLRGQPTREEPDLLSRVFFESASGWDLQSALARPAVLRLLMPSEKAALAARLRDSDASLEEHLKKVRERRSSPSRERPSRGDAPRAVRTPGGFPPGFVADVVAVTGSRGKRDLVAMVAHYGQDGRPTTVSPPSADVSLACADAMRALGMNMLWPAERLPPSGPVILMLPCQAEFLQCLADEGRADSDSAPSAPEGQPVGGRITEPKKIRHVNPVYPETARRAGIQGTVVMEAVISRTGCIGSLEVLRGDPPLHAAAVNAVTGWRYTPTLLGRRPVPVIMTITVNFRLN
jgi:TonB family protein